MSITKDSVSNFIMGVSQQTDKLMYPNQSKVLLNHLPDVVEGLKKRPPSQHVAKLYNGTYSKYPYIHTRINENGKYLVMLDGTGNCKVFDLNGNAKTVQITGTASTYLTDNLPLQNLSAVTFGDYTFILNKTKTVTLSDTVYNPKIAISGTQYETHNKQTALVFVKQGNYSTEYKLSITVNSTTVTYSYTTSEDEANLITTSKIAKTLEENIKTKLSENSLLTEFVISRKGSTIIIANTNSHDFTVNVEDSRGNQNIFSYQEECTASTDLPKVAWKNFMLKINQQAKDGENAYYVRFQTDDGKSVGAGTWVECPKPKEKYAIMNSTMPMVLRPSSTQGYDFDLSATSEWARRFAGDEDTAPNPSFIGHTIQEIFRYKGRLGFLSEDKIILSDATNIYSFFPKSVLTTLDTDPLDIAGNSKVVNLKHTLPFNEELLLFSDTSQFVVKSGDVFSSSTVSIDMATAYQCYPYCKPINLGANGYFVYENGAYSRIMSLYVTESYTIDAEDINVECPSYLKNKVFKLAGSTANHTLVALSQMEQDKLAVYNFYMNGGERTQSAWSKWQFANGKILYAEFDYHLLYLVIQYSDGVFLEKIDFTPKATESNLDYLFHLDRKYTVTGAVYNSTTKTTSFTIPYTVQDEDTFKVVNPQGFEYIPTSISGTTVTIKGNHTNLTVGNTYLSKWQMPTIYVREAANNSMKVKEGILMLRDMNLAYANSGYFTVRVTPKYTTQLESVFKFTGKRTGLPSATLGTVPIESGTFLIPIIAKNDEITISVENDSYLPSCYLSMEWIGDYVERGGS